MRLLRAVPDEVVHVLLDAAVVRLRLLVHADLLSELDELLREVRSLVIVYGELHAGARVAEKNRDVIAACGRSSLRTALLDWAIVDWHLVAP